MQAALITAGLHAVFNTQGRTAATLTDIIDAAAAYLRTFLPATSFVTLSAVVLDPTSGAGTCANCGHPPMLVIGRDGGVRELDGGDNLPLGVGDAPTRSAPLCLAPGEWLAGYTDGLTELSNDDGAMPGLREFTRQVTIACLDALSADAAASAIDAWARAYRGRTAPGDDQTFIVARLLRGSPTQTPAYTDSD
jgi:serine phosphatase RsbU (regulator of sigma subunit)